MQWASAASSAATLATALAEALTEVERQLLGPADLVLVFVTTHHGLRWSHVAEHVAARWPEARLLGASASGVIGGGAEHEDGPGISVVGARLPGVDLVPVRLDADLVGERAGIAPDALASLLPGDPEAVAAVLLLGDPSTCHAAALGAALDRVLPHAAIVGGLASGGEGIGRHALFLDGATYDDGAVAVLLSGDVEVDTIVSQGCEPVGPTFSVTDRRGPVITELDEAPALPALQHTYDALEGRVRALFQRSPMVGIAMDPRRDDPRRGDFLIRPIVGVDPARKGFATGHDVRLDDRLRFHVRDAQAASEDLHELVGRWCRRHAPPTGILLFSCVGRGERFYGTPDHDTRVLREVCGPVPVGGFFCSGEIGPVHGRTFLHGYTSVIVLFRAREWN